LDPPVFRFGFDPPVAVDPVGFVPVADVFPSVLNFGLVPPLEPLGFDPPVDPVGFDPPVVDILLSALYLGLEPPVELLGLDPPVEPVGFEPVEYVLLVLLGLGLDPPVERVVLELPALELFTLAGFSAAGFGGAEPLFLSFLLSSARRTLENASISAIKTTPTRTRERAVELLQMFMSNSLRWPYPFQPADHL
jgi:hypothetical protein